MSAEAAALRPGTTVAKTAADLWLGGRRRQRERQFEQITDAVFDRLEPYPEHEFRGLDESGSAGRDRRGVRHVRAGGSLRRGRARGGCQRRCRVRLSAVYVSLRATGDDGTRRTVDVAAWLETGPFPPPTVADVNPAECVLPDDPAALDIPGVSVTFS
ncbi:hypothetical protein ABZ250_29085 [Streptomyces afghaniensis]|uniref:NACHT N-terminal Helical domain 1-containing protein n=1 Tax=Streptomyces afghaniensis TaxID=66865 RepID=UPI0033A85EC0